jgi:hypothetical protein
MTTIKTYICNLVMPSLLLKHTTAYGNILTPCGSELKLQEKNMCEFQHKNSSILLTSMLCSSSAALEAQWQTILEYAQEMLKVTDNRTHISEAVLHICHY